MPRYYATFIPPHRQREGTETTITYETKLMESTLASDEDDVVGKEEAGIVGRDVDDLKVVQDGRHL